MVSGSSMQRCSLPKKGRIEASQLCPLPALSKSPRDLVIAILRLDRNLAINAKSARFDEVVLPVN
jgi:hypothetical protein